MYIFFLLALSLVSGVICDIGCPVIGASSFEGTQQNRGFPAPEDGNRCSFRNVVFPLVCLFFNTRTMDRVRKLNISESYTPSSESYSNYFYFCIISTDFFVILSRS
jgi:hypothetical protein